MPIETPNYQYPEDIPHVSGDRGNVVLVVRKDASGGLVSLDGDYAPLLVNADGQLKITSNLFPSVKFAPISATLLGVNLVVPLVLLKKIRVLNYVLTAKDEVRATWQGLVTPLSGALFLKETAQPISAAGDPESPLFETLSGEPLNLVLSTATLTTGHLAYVEV